MVAQDSPVIALLREIGIAVKTYAMTGDLKNRWCGLDVGVFGPADSGQGLHWESFAPTPALEIEMLRLAVKARSLKVSLASVSQSVFTARKEIEGRQPFLTPEPVNGSCSIVKVGFRICDLKTALGELGWAEDKAEAACRDYRKAMGLDRLGFEPFLIPLVQVHANQSKLAGALVLYLKPEADALRHLPLIKAIALPLLEIHRHKYGLVPDFQENLEEQILDLFLDFSEADAPFFKKAKPDRHTLDLRFSGKLKGTRIEPCDKCGDADRGMVDCKATGCDYEDDHLCDPCAERKAHLLEDCPEKCWPTLKALFYPQDDGPDKLPREIRLAKVAAFLDARFEAGLGETKILLPGQPAILSLLALRKIAGFFEDQGGAKKLDSSISLNKGNGYVEFRVPLDPIELKKAPTGLRDAFYLRASGASRLGRGNTAAGLWSANFGNFSQHWSRYSKGRIKHREDYLKKILGPRESPIFAINFMADSVNVCWQGILS